MIRIALMPASINGVVIRISLTMRIVCVTARLSNHTEAALAEATTGVRMRVRSMPVLVRIFGVVDF